MKRIDPPLRIAEPCSMDWNAMSGDERKRFCAGCGKHVFNLSAMTGPEAQAFAEETQGRECIAYVQADDGRIHSPGRLEQFLMRLAARRPRWASALSVILPAALASCVHQKGEPLITKGKPSSPIIPVTRQIRHPENGQPTLGSPVPRPTPKTPDLPRVTPGKPAAPASSDKDAH